MGDYDAIIVGARCAGSTLAMRLARAGWRVLMLDRDALGSDTLSTHLIFPNTLARLDELGVMQRLASTHRLQPVGLRVRLLGRAFAGTFTPTGGREHALGVRRPALDRALAETAIAAGAEARFETRVAELIGAGSEEDPVRGVVLDDGERLGARWVLAADGRASSVARKLRLEPTGAMAGDMSWLLSYWRGLPPTPYAHLDVGDGAGANWFPCEDEVHLLITAGPPEHTRGDRFERERKHLERLRRFPTTIDPAWLDEAERVSEVHAAPETMLRGFFKSANGPGWALVGDAGHFKHPGSAQGICDAIEQAVHLADALAGADPQLRDYGRWRDERARGHYEWSFALGHFPRVGVSEPIADGLRDDPAAAQDFRDVLTRRLQPEAVFTAERRARWFAPAAPAAP